MSIKREYIGRISVKLANGRKLELSVYKSGRSIWLNEALVPANRSFSWQGIDIEIGERNRSTVESRDWLEYTGKALF
ncbi:MAG: hypothetical protein V1894_01225 [Chloroflexota bacterium]